MDFMDGLENKDDFLSFVQIPARPRLAQPNPSSNSNPPVVVKESFVYSPIIGSPYFFLKRQYGLFLKEYIVNNPQCAVKKYNYFVISRLF
jgi:hypothetical protein